MQSSEVKNKAKQACLEKYSKEYYGTYGSSEFKDLMVKRYGVENPSQLKKIQQKIHETKKRNNSYGKSSIENQIFQLLVERFPTTTRQYKSDLYP